MKMKSERSILWFSLILSVALALTLSWIDWQMSGPQHQGILFYQFAFTKARSLQILSQWGPAGIALYQKTVWLDFIFPVALAFLERAVLRRRMCTRGEFKGDALFLKLPWIAVVMDYAENAFQIVLSHETAAHADILFKLMSLCAVLKYAAFLLPLMAILRPGPARPSKPIAGYGFSDRPRA